MIATTMTKLTILEMDDKSLKTNLLFTMIELATKDIVDLYSPRSSNATNWIKYLVIDQGKKDSEDEHYKKMLITHSVTFVYPETPANTPKTKEPEF